MSRGSITLGDVAEHTPVLAVACSRCERTGRYNLDTLIVRHWEDFGIPRLLRLHRDLRRPVHVSYIVRSVGGGANPRINGGVFVTVRGVVVRDHQDVKHRFLVSHCDWTVRIQAAIDTGEDLFASYNGPCQIEGQCTTWNDRARTTHVTVPLAPVRATIAGRSSRARSPAALPSATGYPPAFRQPGRQAPPATD